MKVAKVSNYILLLVLLDINKVAAFFANDLWKCASMILDDDKVIVDKDFSHESIIREAFNNFRNRTQDVEDGDILEDIVRGSSYVEQHLSHLSAYHFNAEQIHQGNGLIEELISQLSILPLNSSYTSTVGRYISGIILHLIHDFYSNTDFINAETASGRILSELGTADGYDILGVPTERGQGLFCTDHEPDRVQGNEGNIFHASGWIISGYRSDQDIVKPNDTTPGRIGLRGKCSHGGFYDSSRFTTPTGGINRESGSYLISPHFRFHDKAARSSVRHSEYFFRMLDKKILTEPYPVLSFINTPALFRLIQSDKWTEFLSQYKMLTNYSAVRIYDRHVMKEFNTLSDISVLETQDRIVEEKLLLETILHLPQRSILIIMSDVHRPLGYRDLYREELIKKSLIVKKTKLISFIKTEALHTSITGLKRISDYSGGQMYFYTECTDILHVLYYTPLHLNVVQFTNNTDSISVSIAGSISSILSVNCFYKPLQSPVIETAQGTVKVSLLASPPSVTIYNITNTDKQPDVLFVELPKHFKRHEKCEVLVFSSKNMLDVTPLLEGPRKQLFPNTQRGVEDCRISVQVHEPTLKLESIRVARDALKLETCGHENTSLLYISETLPADLPSEHDIIVHYKEDGNSFKQMSYVTTQRIQVVLPFIIDLRNNTLTIEATVINKKWEYIDSEISVMMNNSESRLNIASKEIGLSPGESRDINMNVDQAPEYTTCDVIISPAFLIVKLTDPDGEFHEVFEFYVLSNKPASPPPTTTTQEKTLPHISEPTTLRTTPKAPIVLPTTLTSIILPTTTPLTTIRTMPTPSPTTVRTTLAVTTKQSATISRDIASPQSPINILPDQMLSTGRDVLTNNPTSEQASPKDLISATTRYATSDTVITSLKSIINKTSTIRPLIKTPSVFLETNITMTEGSREVSSISTNAAMPWYVVFIAVVFSTLALIGIVVVIVLFCRKRGACKKKKVTEL